MGKSFEEIEVLAIELLQHILYVTVVFYSY